MCVQEWAEKENDDAKLCRQICEQKLLNHYDKKIQIQICADIK